MLSGVRRGVVSPLASNRGRLDGAGSSQSYGVQMYLRLKRAPENSGNLPGRSPLPRMASSRLSPAGKSVVAWTTSAWTT